MKNHKTAWIVARSHMDPLWRRGHRDEFLTSHSGEPRLVRSYDQIQSDQVLAGMDLAEREGVPYGIEQVLTLRRFLERHPDQEARLGRLVAEGKIEIYGGGETVIDTNLVDAESLLRNHLYAQRWLEKRFGFRLRSAWCPDTFGVSAQMPQILRSAGYVNLGKVDRVFANRKKYWKGLDGTVIGLLSVDSLVQVVDVAHGPAGRYEPCPSCKGEGCAICDENGIDRTEDDRFASNWAHGRFLAALDRAMEAEDKDLFAKLWAEEIIEAPGAGKRLLEHLRKRGITEVRPGTLDALERHWFAKEFEALEAGKVPEAEIDPRVEGNPMGTGCYLARIDLKRSNRSLMDRLASLEKLSVLAFQSDPAFVYPGAEIERMWRDLSLFQFHDSVTGSHTDAACLELERLARGLRTDAARLSRRAFEVLASRTDFTAPAGRRSFLLFNPLGSKVEHAVHEHVLDVALDDRFDWLDLIDGKGKTLTVLSVERTELAHRARVKVRFTGATLAPLANDVFHWKPTGRPALEAPRSMANEFYRIVYDASRILRIRDLRLDVDVVGELAGSLVAEQDIGSPWETLTAPAWNRCLSHERSVVHRLEAVPGGRRLVFSGTWRQMATGEVKSLRWEQSITLLDGLPRIDFRTTVDWDARNARVEVIFPLGIRTPNDEAIYGVPGGALKRVSYAPTRGDHLCLNGDWPALDFFAVEDRERNFTAVLLNRGLPAHRFQNGLLHLGLMRSPGETLHVFDIEGALEKGERTFEYALCSHRGSFADGRVQQDGVAFNSAFPSFNLTEERSPVKSGVPAGTSLLGIEGAGFVLQAVKKAEDDGEVVVRVQEALGRSATVILPAGNWKRVDGLERPVAIEATAPLHSFEIATWKGRPAR